MNFYGHKPHPVTRPEGAFEAKAPRKTFLTSDYTQLPEYWFVTNIRKRFGIIELEISASGFVGNTSFSVLN